MTLLTVAALLLALLALTSLTGGAFAGDVSSSFDLDDCDDCGIDKLSSEELANLVAMISSSRGMSFLDESAGQYLRKQGWAPTEIIGYQPDTSMAAGSDDVLTLVVREGKLYAMEPPIGEDAWELGLYWSKDTFISSWQVISPEGEVENCDISELR